MAAVSTPDRNASKKFLFELTDEEQTNVSRRVKFAEQMPAVRKTDNNTENENLQQDRQAFQFVVNTWWRNRSLCQRTRTWLENRLAAPEAATDDTFASVTNIKALDPTFLCTFFGSLPNVTYGQLAVAIAKDPETHQQLAIFILRCTLTMKLPKECKSRPICNRSLKLLAEACGNRTARWNGINLVNDSGTLNWFQMGPYECVVDDDELTKVLHRPTGDTCIVPNTFSIKKPFNIDKPWSDLEACITKDKLCENISNWFDVGKGPNAFEINKGQCEVFNALVRTAVTDHQNAVARTNTTDATPVKSIMADEQCKKRKETMSKARSALTAKKAKIEKTRTTEIK